MELIGHMWGVVGHTLYATEIDWRGLETRRKTKEGGKTCAAAPVPYENRGKWNLDSAEYEAGG